jgi:DNA helicase-2/ATP-dependent DNA helicase PcrA
MVEGRKIDYKKELNDEQYKVVTTADGPCLVLAGAGSGKTRTLVYRVAYLLEQGVSPQNILLVTFTNKAAREMLERIEELMGGKPQGLWGGTFHHIGNRILRKYGQAIGVAPNFTIMDADDSLSLIKNCLKEVDVPTGVELPKPKVAQTVISLSANMAKPVTEILKDRFSYLDYRLQSVIEKTAERYRMRKEAGNMFDYDDLLAKWYQLLSQSDAVRKTLSTQFKYILVDEYQDTNYIQNAVIKNLSGEHANVLVVGDDAQSLYSFRGATVSNILAFPKSFPSCQIFKLLHNYRSLPEILALANQSIAHNSQQYSKDLITTRPSGDKPRLIQSPDVYEQARFIGDEIEQLIDRGQCKVSDIAILFRSHYHSLELEIELNSRGYSYIMRGGLRFFEQAHIKDVVAYLKIIGNHQDQISWQRVLQLEAGIGEAGARKLAIAASDAKTLADALAVGENIKITPRARTGWQRLTGILKNLIDVEVDNVPSLIERLLLAGYEKHLSAQYDNYNDRLEDIKQLAQFAGRYETLAEFLVDSALSESFGKRQGSDTNVNALILSTIHQAKGLEWPVVFVIGLTEGQFPHSKVADNPQELEEERRLFYVAVTRARDRLYLSYPVATRNEFYGKPSQFITEVDRSLYDIGVQNDLDDDEVRYEDDEY